MKRRFLIAILFCLSVARGQDFTTAIPFEDHARGIDIIKTKDQGYLITGNTMNPGSGKANLLLAKLDSRGELEWKKEVGDPDRSLFGWSMLETEKGYLVMGFSDLEHRSRPMVYTFDFRGNLLEQKELPVDDQGIVWSIMKTISGHFYGVGEQSLGDSRKGVWVFRFDAGGNILQQNREQLSPGNQRAFYISGLANGRLVVAGTSSDSGKENDDVLVRCYDEDLELLWTRVLDVRGRRDVGHAVKADQEGIYVYGYYEDPEGSYNPMILQLDQEGSLVQKHLLSSPNSDIRIMNGAKLESSHYLLGYAREGATPYFKVSLVEYTGRGDTREVFLGGQKGMNTGYCLKRVSDSELIMTGAITEEDGGTSNVLVKKITPYP